MDFFTTLFTHPSHWLVLGFVLLIAEALGTSGFLIGAAVAAFVSAAIALFVPDMSVGWQLGIYSVLAVVSTYVYFEVFRDMQKHGRGERFNRRAEGLVGTQFVLEEGIRAGTETRVQLGDTMWRVHSDEAIEAGRRVEVVSAETMRLEIASVAQEIGETS